MKRRTKLPDGIQVHSKRPELKPGVPWIGYVQPKHIKPNPNQPREEFPEESQEELQESHSQVGQIRPISVIPCEDKEDQNIWFMIHDGERSWRSLSALDAEAVLVLYNPLINTDDIDFLSFVANFGGRGHTHKETIKAVWKNVKEKGIPVKTFSQAVTRSEVWVQNYLVLHNLHPELQKLMDPPTPKEQRLPSLLARTIACSDQAQQIEIYKKTKGMSAKVAQRHARKLVNEGNQVQGRKQKPSDHVKVLRRILRTMDEDMRHLREIPPEVFEGLAFDMELFELKLGLVITIGLKAYKKITGKMFSVVDEKAVAELMAKRRFGANGKKGIEEIGLDDIIPANGSRAAQTL